MDPYHIFIDGGKKPSFVNLCNYINRVLTYLDPELLVVNTHLDPKEIIKKFPETLSLKLVNYQGTYTQNIIQFCNEYPSEWILLCRYEGKIDGNAVNRYKNFYKGKTDCIYLPAYNSSLDLSGHLAFLSYYSYRRLQPDLTLQENFLELTNNSITFIGVQGVIMRKKI